MKNNIFNYLICFISLFLISCDKADETVILTPELKARQEALFKKSMDNMIFIPGGEFTMGIGKSSHKVKLTGFYMSDSKVSFHDYMVYVDSNKTEFNLNDSGSYPLFLQKKWDELKEKPASKQNFMMFAEWVRAKDYCTWLAKETQLPYDLPTEAQWEYVATELGSFKSGYPTDTQYNDPGYNTFTGAETGPIKIYYDGIGLHPIKLLFSNRLGIYDLYTSAFYYSEWVNDFYTEDYYLNSQFENPVGPDKGIFLNPTFLALNDEPRLKTVNTRYMARVSRGGDLELYERQALFELPKNNIESNPKDLDTYLQFGKATFRCVINESGSLN